MPERPFREKGERSAVVLNDVKTAMALESLRNLFAYLAEHTPGGDLGSRFGGGLHAKKNADLASSR